MKRFKNLWLDTTSVKQAAENCVKKNKLALLITLIGLMLALTAQARNSTPLSLTPAVIPTAAFQAKATTGTPVVLKEDLRGVDTLAMQAEDQPANLTFAVFLTELAEARFDTVQYMSNFKTKATGIESLPVGVIIEEAFLSTVFGGVRVHKELGQIVFGLADPAADDFRCAPGTGPMTPCDEDSQTGAAEDLASIGKDAHIDTAIVRIVDTINVNV